MILIYWLITCCTIGVILAAWDLFNFVIWINKENDNDEIWLFPVGLYIAILISLFISLFVLLWKVINQTPFEEAKGLIIYLSILISLRLIISFFKKLNNCHQKKIKIAQFLEGKEEKAERKILAKVEKKNLTQLLARVKEESSNLITLTNEETAEMIDAIRKKAHSAFNEFTSKKVSFGNTRAVLEEALADLLSLKEMLHPLRNDVITFDDILGIKPDDSKESIKQAYKELIQIVHPDRIPTELKDKASEITSLINTAYEHVKNNNGRRMQ